MNETFFLVCQTALACVALFALLRRKASPLVAIASLSALGAAWVWAAHLPPSGDFGSPLLPVRRPSQHASDAKSYLPNQGDMDLGFPSGP